MTMSDRIAVMNDGLISQVGTPDELYLTPNNTFVARFIGNPSMNFVTGTLESADSNSAVVELDGVTLDLPIERVGDVPADDALLVGFRPEDVELDPEGDEHLTGEVTLVERIGDRLQATIEGPEGELRVIVPSDRSLTEGQTVSLAFDPSQAHLFDADTQEIFARGTEPMAIAD